MSIKILDAVKNNLYSQLILYLKHGYNFKVKTLEGHNALMISLTIQNSERRFKMFEFLLRNDFIDVLDADQNSRNIFFWAVIKQCVPELDLLMRNHHMEINWSQIDNSGKTLLHHGVLTNNEIIMSLLLKYCAKYKINVDIPENKEKLTPYLLACRLNFHKIADLLIEFGNASKNQFDENSHLNAIEWKEEGKLEKLKAYMNVKRKEMDNAKLSGNINKFNELNYLSKSIDTEIHRNPEIIPIFAKAIVENDDRKIEDTNYNYNHSNYNEFDNLHSFEDQDTENLQTPTKENDQLANFFKKTIMNKHPKPLEKVNQLLEMAQGKSADGFIASKSYKENTHEANSIRSPNQNSISSGIVDLFDVATFQQSVNYRSPAKKPLNYMPISFTEKKITEKKKKHKTGLSTLAIIREESKLANTKKLPKSSMNLHVKTKKHSSKSLTSMDSIHS